MPELRGAVVVLVGASSGIGRAAAQCFAREGARLVLASRRADTLAPVVEECRRLGVEAVAMPTDAGDAEAVRRLAGAALDRFGRVDVWVNNAGVGAVGDFEAVPLEAHERVIRTNLLGALHGAHAVLPAFKRQGAGVMINTLSVGAFLPTPQAASYAASKHAVRGLAESLRAELRGWPGIRVCDVYPAAVDSPGLRHGANYAGRELRAGAGAASPFEVAETIVSLARRPRAAVSVGWPARLLWAAARLAPGLVRGAMARAVPAGLRAARPVEVSPGNLFEAPPDHAVYGGFRPEGRSRGPGIGWLAAAAALGVWIARRR